MNPTGAGNSKNPVGACLNPFGCLSLTEATLETNGLVGAEIVPRGHHVGSMGEKFTVEGLFQDVEHLCSMATTTQDD